MCEFVSKLFADSTRIQTKYEVLSFAFETVNCWFFNVRLIELKVHGKIYPKEQPVKLMGFLKRREESDKGETCQIECMPPEFYDRLRNKALRDGLAQMPGYNAPPLEDEDLFL